VRSPSPAFSFYPKDWLSDGPVREMTHEEKGVYADLLSIYWLEDGLPSDPERLARLVAIPAKRFMKLWPAISRCFQESEGRLVQKRLEGEKAKQLSFRNSQSTKGKLGGKSKVINKNSKPRLTPGLTGAKPKVTLPSPSPSPSPSSTPTPDNGNGSAPAAPDAAPPKVNWVSEACDDWNARYGPGSAKGGKIGSGLKAVVSGLARSLNEPEIESWQGTVRPAWRRYLSETTHPSPSPSDFAEHFANWTEPNVSTGLVPFPARAPTTKAQAGMERMRAMVSGGLKGGGS
jgi:uncharacterized protein YdaU (DUF1376 family)